MLLLGGITSLPEIATVTTASRTGSPSLAVNNLIGSAAGNVLLLAVADVVLGRDALTSVVATPSTLLQGTLVPLRRVPPCERSWKLNHGACPYGYPYGRP